MAVVQEAFDIPANIMTKILAGEYRRIGGVVRYANGPHKGQIVKHLKPVDLKTAEQAQGVGVKAIQFAKKNKYALIIAGIGTGVAAAGAGIYHKIKIREPEVVSTFRITLKDYISAIRSGNLDMKDIDNLMVSLEKLKKHKDYEKISIQLSTEELDILVNKIYECTLKLAKDNSVELLDEEQNPMHTSTGAIGNLQKYLNAQKRIFEVAA